MRGVTERGSNTFLRTVIGQRQFWFGLAALVAAGSIAIALHPDRAMLALFTGLVFATFVSEDLTCLTAGAMVAEGRVGFLFAVSACLLGIFLGDLLLFLAGRLIGGGVVDRAPVKWFVRKADVDRATAWFERRGWSAILISRFVPGTRLPTYVAAGLLKTDLLKFTTYFLVAAAVWTPLLVGAATVFGSRVVDSANGREHLFTWLALSVAALGLTVRLILRLATFRGRRQLVGAWRRWTKWEFWPLWLFYPPVIVYALYLGLQYRCLTLFTSANPAIPEGGFTGESKNAILRGLAQTPTARAQVAAWRMLRSELSLSSRIVQARAFMRDRETDFPIVLKPDTGERGSGVKIVRSHTELEQYLRTTLGSDVIIQQYAPGEEFGIFYYRRPSESSGHIFSITRKVFPRLTGDGRSSREELIYADPRAVCLAQKYVDAQGDLRSDIPPAGETFPLIDIGTHSRGSIFLDGNEIRTAELEQAIDRLAKGFPGFYFGRFDIRTPSIADLRCGRNFKVVELNGVTSEATHIYDPRHSLLAAYRTLFEQWRIAFAIGAENRAAGAQPASLGRLARIIFTKWRGPDERNRPEPRPIGGGVNPNAPLLDEI